MMRVLEKVRFNISKFNTIIAKTMKKENKQ